jgi:uncharacterized protein YecA (UPF0149 family)
MALAHYGTDASIATAIEIYLEDPHDPERNVILRPMYMAKILRGQQDKKTDTWRKKLDKDYQKFKKSREEIEELMKNPEHFAEWENALKPLPPVKEPMKFTEVDTQWRAPVLPFRKEAPKVGRNDPCPCGSGKKYKRWCLGK